MLTLPALLLYFHDIFVTAKQFHNVNLKNDALCKTYAAVFTLIVQTYIFCRSNHIIYLTPTPRGTNYYLHKWGDMWPCSTHVAYFCKVTQINLLVFLTLVIYFLFKLTRNRYTISCSLSASRAITSISKQQLLKILKLNVRNTSVCALNYTISVCRKKKSHLENWEPLIALNFYV